MKRYKLLCNIIVFLFCHLSLAEELKMGHADILVSDHGLPKENYEFSINNKKYKTDENGFFSIELKEGRHEILLQKKEKVEKVPFAILEGQRSQLILNLFEGDSDIDRNEPKKEKKIQRAHGKLGKVQGQVFSISGGEPIAGAKIFVKNIEQQVATDNKGNFELELPEGEHTLSFTHRKFSTEILNRVKVKEGEANQRTIRMTPSGLVLEDFVVLAPRVSGSIEALIEVRRKASDVADVMSAEQMAKSGDSDAAGSLRRVTGLTLKDGKYVYIRGLGERYSSTLLNGISLPSPDPTRRVVPLDLFPVKFLDSMVIQKSYSPDRTGEFGGGTVMLQTKKMPEKFFAKLSLSQSVNSRIGNRLSYPGGSKDALGFDDGTRAMPVNLEKSGGDANVFLTKNRHNITVNEGQDTLPDLSLSIGTGWKSRKVRQGYSFSALYTDRLNRDLKERIRYRENTEGNLEQDEKFTRDKNEREVMLGGIASVNTRLFKNFNIDTHFIILRNTTNYVATQEGVDFEGQQLRTGEREWAERELKTFLVQSENRLTFLGNSILKGHYALSDARRYEPDRITDTYTKTKTGYRFKGITDADNTSYQRRYFNLKDEAQDMGLSLRSFIPWFYKRKVEFTLGTSTLGKSRDSAMRRFGIDIDRQQVADQSVVDGSEQLDQIFQNCIDCFSYFEGTRPTDNYSAEQEVQAYFFKSKVPVFRSLDFNVGMRYENSRQRVTSFVPFQLNGERTSILTTKDWLPASSLAWRFHPKMQLRLAYSETIARPDFMEISDTTWRDFERGFAVTGNPNLQATVINSYDLRWEWYFARKGNLSFSVFYKNFENPVEQIFVPDSELRTTFINASGATNYGAEMEFMLPFTGWFKNFSMGGNYSQIVSEISLENATQALVRNKNRPLQGQSSFTANLLLNFEKESWGLNASLAYNIIGPRIALIGPDELPDVVEQPVNQLDFVFSKKVGKSMRLGGKIQNFLDAQYRFTQGGLDWETGRRGQAYSLSLTMEI